MPVSVFDLFKVGIGPSSSHTVGPMIAAHRFLLALDARGLLDSCARVDIQLFGSLALTGRGHATDTAVILGLAGELPHSVEPIAAERILQDELDGKGLCLNGRKHVEFARKNNIDFRIKDVLDAHPNGMRFFALDPDGEKLLDGEYYSVGGGFVLAAEETEAGAEHGSNVELPFAFNSAVELLSLCESNHLTIAELVRANERTALDDHEIDSRLDRIWEVMEASIEQGCRSDGILPGGLKVRRRAASMYRELTERPEAALRDPLAIMDWVNLYALAVNEENAAGGRVVTAPTNGAAGVIPAVLAYYHRFTPGADRAGIRTFLLTAAAIGMLYKENASISAAEVGCQGEVGVACSMAAGALCAVLGGTLQQIENAAEIGMEHNLGLTCDPIAGLVQIPCIERNTMGAIKAINAARLALKGDGQHFVSLDKVIETMRDTGRDMMAKYKETSLGGLAVNVVEC